MRSHYDEALAALESVACRAEAMGSLRSLMAALNNMAIIYERKGAFDKCEACRKCRLQLAEQMDLPDKVAWTLAQAAPSGTGARGGKQPECWSPVLAQAYLEMGDDVRACEILEKGIAVARQRNHRQYLVDALRVWAHVAGCQERWEEAERALEELLPMVRDMPYPYAEARALYEYGLLHMKKGEPHRAQERLEAARAIFCRLGARPSLERTEQTLLQLG